MTTAATAATAAANDDTSSDHYRRLLEGMARAVAEKGYADVTIADIVREAAVSRRTFYEHFSGKQECLIALYTAASRGTLDVLRAALDPALAWNVQVEKSIGAYFACLARNPPLLRTLFVEILGLGPVGLAARRRINEQIATFIGDIVNSDPRRAGTRPLTPELAMAIVGGINELILQAIEQGQVDRIGELALPAIALVKALT
ncbi:TetR/AcrR family transcriptional regulator [Oxalobacteraceae bacterium OM1]|nr:TetR/AcrR family transcriptional regulator [Oxalobacteraceae bacterium OM1]